MRIIDPPIATVFESCTPYQDFFYTDHREWVVPDTDKIKTLAATHDFVIANCSTEHWGSERDFPLVARLNDLLAEHFGKDFVCLCHDPSDAELRENILYFPFFAYWRESPRRSPDLAAVASTHRNYLFSNLNFFARDFRIANYLWWRQQSFADKCLISMYNMVQDHHAYDGHFNLTNVEIENWQRLRSSLRSKVPIPPDNWPIVFAFGHPAFCDSYLHLVSESTCKDKIFITEKTWQTVAAGQLFMVWGNEGIISHLRGLGVDVFDDIIDHGYDKQTDHRLRLTMIHGELDRLSHLDWPAVYKQTLHRRLSNCAGFENTRFIEPHIRELRSRLPTGSF